MQTVTLKRDTTIVTHSLAVLVDNESGVLARVIGLFSARGYNIESLSVSQIDSQKNLSRITVVTSGTPSVITQIKNQLNRLVRVHGVADLTQSGPVVEREIALFKVVGTGENRVEALRLADAFKARMVDATQTSFIFEVTGDREKINAFADVMRPIGLIDVARAGIVAMARGDMAMQYFEAEKDFT